MPALALRQRRLRQLSQYTTRVRKLRQREELLRDGQDLSYSSDSDQDTETRTSSSLSDTSAVSSTSEVSSGSASDAGMDGDSSQSSEEDADVAYLGRIAAIRNNHHFLTATRVINPSLPVDKPSQLGLTLYRYKLRDPKRFRRNLRVSAATFDALLERIQDHPEFFNGSNREQMPVPEQLVIALFRHYGSSASVESIAQMAGVSAGMVVNATRRVMIAFLSLHGQVMRWPSAAEKEEAKGWVEAASCAAWRDGFVLVDGTLVKLAEKPAHHGEAYFDRKSSYSLNVQVRKHIHSQLCARLMLFQWLSSLRCRISVSSTMSSDIAVVSMIQPHSSNRAHTKNITSSSGRVNGFGRIQHTPQRRGV